jgi:hypothetical protein
MTSTNIFELEQTVMKDLRDYYTAYRLYMTCRDNHPYYDNNNRSNSINTSICGGTTDDLLGNLTTAKTTLDGSIRALKDMVGAYDDAVKSGTINPPTQSELTNNYNEILATYKSIITKRQALDASLTELYEIGDTTNNFYQKKLISTSYTKILLITIATSLTVAAFMVTRNK